MEDPATVTVAKTAKNDEETSSSLLHRLAGPSTGKAGLAKDQTEINRIIAEASKGSKFYEERNEKRKDEELTKKIADTLRLRDQLLANADIPKCEAFADQVLKDLEATRDLSQYIVHVDLDAFFANVEVLHDPSLKGKAFGVGGGVLSTASYEARAYGARSGMPTHIARKLCPHLLLIRGHYERYSIASKQVMEILDDYDSNMLVAGQDEAYLNITKYCEDNQIDPQECVRQMRTRIFEETKLTASAGIAPNTMIAKICSDKNKPNGQYFLPFTSSDVLDFMKDLPIRKIPGIGRVTERLLDSIGIKKCGDIYTHRATLVLMDKQFHSREKLSIYLGLGSTHVEPSARESRKSVGYERTFSAISDTAMIVAKLDMAARELEEDLKRTGFAGRTVTLKLKLNTFEVRSRAKSLPNKLITKYEDLFAIGKELLDHELPVTIRLLGLRVTNLKDLRAPEHGIKKFFEAGTSTKRRKLNDGTAMIISDGENEDDDDIQEIPPPLPIRAATQSPRRSQKAALDPPERAQSQAPEDPAQSSQSRVLSSFHTREPSPIPQNHLCPICDKEVQADNVGFNAHIDFCLSRSAIMEASKTVAVVQNSLAQPAQKPRSTNQKSQHKNTPSSSRKAPKQKQDIRLAWKKS